MFFQLIPCQSSYCHDFTSETLLHNYSCQHILLIQLIYARSFPGQRTVSLAGKRADILQNIVSTTFANSNYFYQSGLNPLRLVSFVNSKRFRR